MYALERREIKFRGSKTEYVCVNVKETRGKMKMQGAEVVETDELKYLG